MKIAFLIGAYKNPEYLHSLIEMISCEDTNIYVHINKKNKDDFRDLISYYENCTNVHIYSEIKVHWGGVSLLKSMLFLINKASEDSDNAYFHFLTGQDILVRPLNELITFCNKNENTNYIECKPYTHEWDSRYSQYHLYDYVNYLGSKNARLLETVFCKIQKLFHVKRASMKLDWLGSGWWSLNRRAIDVIRNYFNNASVWKRLSFTFAPDEVVFQNILQNSSLKGSIYGENLCYIDWNNSASPRILGEEDYDAIVDSGKFFARKIDPEVSKGLIGIIKQNNKKQEQ